MPYSYQGVHPTNHNPLMKLFTALLVAAVSLHSLATTSAQADDFKTCQQTWTQLKELGLDPSKSMKPCTNLVSYKTPAQRVQAAGGRTALIRKCEAIWKPQLKDQRSYRYDSANVAAAAKSLKVTVTYSAKNSFGGYVPGTFTCNFGG